MSTKKGKIPHINLNNFEDKKFENSDYILTSPLSLQACKNLGLRPIELFTNDSDNDKEEIRKSNLQRARTERNALVDEVKRQQLVVTGRLISKDEDEDKSDNESQTNEDRFHDEPSSGPDNNYIGLSNSYIKEINFQQKRRELQELEKEDKNELKRNIEMKLSRAARNREIIQRNKYREIEDKREQFLRKARNVSSRRRRLDKEIQNYHRELENFQNLSLRSAEEKSSRRLQCDTAKIHSEREQKELMIKYKRQMLEEETEVRTHDLMYKIVERDRQDEEFMRRKLEKMMESRCYANEAQKLRLELREVYNLDSFDKKVTNVEAVNRVLK